MWDVIKFFALVLIGYQVLINGLAFAMALVIIIFNGIAPLIFAIT